jgi:ABC-2 type transport system permease protein
VLPAGPTGAVVGKELRAWRRDPGRTLLLLLALLVGGLNLAVPAVAFQLPAVLPWVGLGAALIVSTGAANVYGDDGTALWLTRMVPGVERADVRGRQLAWLLVVAPVMALLTVALTASSGQGWAWPWVLATLPAVLGGTAGLGLLLSVTMPVREKDPHRRTGPFDTGDDPATAGALAGRGYLMLLLAALCAVPGATLVLLGTVRHQPVLQAAGVLVGTAIGVLLAWWGGGVAARRLADRGAELMDLLHLGPPAQPRRDPARPIRQPAVPMPRWKSGFRSLLFTVGIVCVVPQGLVPIAFNLFGVDPQVKVWFVARYLPQDLQTPVAAGFIATGVLAIWWAVAITRSHTEQH